MHYSVKIICLALLLIPAVKTMSQTAEELAAPALIAPVVNSNPLPEYDIDRLDYGMTIGIERTTKGRIWACWVGGGDNPDAFFILGTSDDDGQTWSKPRAVIDAQDPSLKFRRRILVGNLWMDPVGRLWLFFDQSMDMFDGRAGSWYTICENPDSNQPVWSAPVRISYGSTLSKPIVSKDGTWYLPVSLWDRSRVKNTPFENAFHELDTFRMANVFASVDQGKTWTRRGGVRFDRPNLDEHHITERKDGSLWLTARTQTGIMESISIDQGVSWSTPKKAFEHTTSRHFIRRLASGRLLLVKHGRLQERTKVRSRLMAFLSDDEGKTWEGGLMLDERRGISYPDGFQAPDGYIYISYDRNREADGEVLMARFTEEDVLKAAFLGKRSKDRILIFKPGTIEYNRHSAGLRSRQPRWQIQADGSLNWKPDHRLPHYDHIEMTGEQTSAIIRYGVDEKGAFTSSRTLVWPMLKKKGDGVRDHLKRDFSADLLSHVHLNGLPLQDEKVTSIQLDGTLRVQSWFKAGLECTRTLFPSNRLPFYIERFELRNSTKKLMQLEVPEYTHQGLTNPEEGYYGGYQYGFQTKGAGTHSLKPGEKVELALLFSATVAGSPISISNLEEELSGRKERVRFWWSNLVLETPQEELNTAFAFAKLRTAESIFRTKAGLLHSPGGGDYYAAIWANDQAEYVGPLFPFLGYAEGNEASLNAYRQFARYMNKEYRPLPCSIISEGDSIWNSVGDRGDAAMIAYGAARYALARGIKTEAEELWPLISWCLEYCRRKLNIEGVVESDTDELEGRFPTGKANLSTSSLYYDALVSAAALAGSLKQPMKVAKQYTQQAAALRKAIEQYFGSMVEGYPTYQYYSGNKVLRAWICLPLTMDLFERSKPTIEALFSSRLWTPDGLATEAGKSDFWDRATLYALRGVFAAGEKEKALSFLTYYTKRRLLEEHVPYPVEAYPEGNQRHLSAESGLYCRIFTEGLFGIRPTGLNSFTVRPQLPAAWNQMALRHVQAFGKTFHIEISRTSQGIRTRIITDGKVVVERTAKDGELIQVSL
jgi:hypothetical protein